MQYCNYFLFSCLLLTLFPLPLTFFQMLFCHFDAFFNLFAIFAVRSSTMSYKVLLLSTGFFSQNLNPRIAGKFLRSFYSYIWWSSLVKLAKTCQKACLIAGSPRPWSSLVVGGEGLYLPNSQINLVIALCTLSLLFCKLINKTAYHLGRYLLLLKSSMPRLVTKKIRCLLITLWHQFKEAKTCYYVDVSEIDFMALSSHWSLLRTILPHFILNKVYFASLKRNSLLTKTHQCERYFTLWYSWAKNPILETKRLNTKKI